MKESRFNYIVHKTCSHGQIYSGVNGVSTPQGLFVLCKEGSKIQAYISGSPHQVVSHYNYQFSVIKITIINVVN